MDRRLRSFDAALQRRRTRWSSSLSWRAPVWLTSRRFWPTRPPLRPIKTLWGPVMAGRSHRSRFGGRDQPTRLRVQGLNASVPSNAQAFGCSITVTVAYGVVSAQQRLLLFHQLVRPLGVSTMHYNCRDYPPTRRKALTASFFRSLHRVGSSNPQRIERPGFPDEIPSVRLNPQGSGHRSSTARTEPR